MCTSVVLEFDHHDVAQDETLVRDKLHFAAHLPSTLDCDENGIVEKEQVYAASRFVCC